MNNFQEKLKGWLWQRQQDQSHRQLLVVSGSQTFCRSVLSTLTEEYPKSATTLLGRSLYSFSKAQELKRYRHLLGSECQLAIYDAFDALRPNAVLALAGTVARGGLMVICCPPLTQWAGYQEQTSGHYLSYGETCLTSPLRQYLAAEFKHGKSVALYSEDGELSLPLGTFACAPAGVRPPAPFATEDQHRIFSQIAARLNGLRCALITAHRGRGKSTLMGMVAGQSLLNNTPVIVTSRHESAAEMVFKGLALTCPDIVQIAPQQYSYNGVLCSWLPLDHPSLNNPDNHLVIIDEAAATPIPQLKQLCSAASRVLLSTTMIGYEGSGRGFITRFIPWLTNQYDALAHYSLQTPVRWFAGDPLEHFWHSAFGLNTAEGPLAQINQPNSPLAHNRVRINTVDRSSLVVEHKEQILGLLMQAHYQTTADELVRLTDSPNQHTLTATSRGTVIGVLHYQLEGSHYLKPVADAVASGTRRVNGHLSAQALALLVADPQFATFSYWRINRIAVLPSYRRKGVGRKLVEALKAMAKAANIDGITTSFGTTDELVCFWQRQQFVAVKPGLKKDAASGEYSLLMLRPISEALSAHSALIDYRYGQELKLHPAPKSFARYVVKPLSDKAITDACNHRILTALVDKHRSIQHSNAAVAWLLTQIESESIPPGLQVSYEVLSHYIAMLNTPKMFIQRYTLNGKRAAEDYVVEHLTRLYQHTD
ncbi:GNAT family N-acetyltransferase [Alteromonas gilva]|uniref:GNAT family N-acetyltransferase n=1 Tax=Alteromonas gilva TaxID=2987522 RepID=A0ABT5L482_9ALTE|nr:GNAT family N-acetyltransferase [Alteromonas gilva]MDC8831662.1 GNAT family N-acetyltransferase [Alteromonas gilva]